ncbi:hypothetical protein [Microcoleus sp. FACHB-672]|nr:hypothetical protein [Microcoleus sp. FACHB-672]
MGVDSITHTLTFASQNGHNQDVRAVLVWAWSQTNPIGLFNKN